MSFRGTEGFIVYAEAYRSYLTVLHNGRWIEAITARTGRPFIAFLYLYSEQVIRDVESYNTIVKWMHWIVENVNDNHSPVITSKLNQ